MNSTFTYLVFNVTYLNSDENVIPVMAPFLGPSVTPGASVLILLFSSWASLTPNKDTPWDWNYTTTAQPGLDNRAYPYPRGRLLGGSSSASTFASHALIFYSY